MKHAMPNAMKHAMTHPVHLGVAAAAATLAIGLGSVALAALGALAYAALVAFDARGRVRIALPAAPSDPGLRRAVAELRASRAALDRALAATPGEVRAALATTLGALPALEDQAARLVQRGDDVTRHLATVDEAGRAAEIAALVRRAEATRDAAARRGFDDARAARQDELRTLDELRAARDRIDASLLHLVAVLGGLPTKVVHMRALDRQAADALSGDVHAELAAIADELATSEQLMKSFEEVMR